MRQKNSRKGEKKIEKNEKNGRNISERRKRSPELGEEVAQLDFFPATLGAMLNS